MTLIRYLKRDYSKYLKILLIQGTDHIELSFKIRFYPIDVTQVLQYVTLYQVDTPNNCYSHPQLKFQAFLAARHDVVNGKLSVTARDSMLLAALSLQVW